MRNLLAVLVSVVLIPVCALLVLPKVLVEHTTTLANWSTKIHQWWRVTFKVDR